jgi:hypothetical protein
LILAATLSISGCSGLDPVRFADGNPGYRASCPGFGDDYSRCYQQAAEVCSSAGYDLMTRDGSTNYDKTLREGYSAQGAEYRLLYGSVHFRSVYLRCRTVVSLGDP